jgi:protease I
MSLKAKKLVIFVEKLYEDLELWYPYIRMKEEGATVVLVGPKMDTYSGKHGIPATPEKTIDQIDASDFDALIIPGGYSPDHMRRTPEMVDFVKKMVELNKPVATICHGGWMLASANVVKNKKVTGFYSIKDDLVHAGGNWLDEPVVNSDNIITSRNPGDLPDFCRAIISALA